MSPDVQPTFKASSSSTANCPCIVTVWAIISANGRVTKARVVRPVASDLDEAALQAVKQWRFTPTRNGNTAVAVEVNLDVKFDPPSR
jgi:TonB family protein